MTIAIQKFPLGKLLSNQSFMGVISQVLFSATNFAVALVSASLLVPAQLAQMAFVSSALITASTLISASVVVAYSLSYPRVNSSLRRSMLRASYNTQSFVFIVAASVVVFVLSILLLGSIELAVAAAVYSILYLLRFSQRGFQIAERKGRNSFLTEVMGTAPVIVVLGLLVLVKAQVSSSQLLYVLSACIAPSVIVSLWISKFRIIPHLSVFRSFRKHFGVVGRYSLLGAFPSEALASGHVYVLTLMGQSGLLAHIYLASLFFRHFTILLTGLNAVQRSSFVSYLHEGRAKFAAKMALVSSGVLGACVAVNIIGLYFFIPTIVSAFASEHYSTPMVQYWFVVWGAVNILLATRYPLFTLAQALKKLRDLAGAVSIAAGVAAVILPIYFVVRTDWVLASALLIPGVVYTALVVLTVRPVLLSRWS